MARPSVLDSLNDTPVYDGLKERVQNGQPWTEVLAYLAEQGVATSESSLRRWCDRNDLVKVAPWEAPASRAALLERHEAASKGDTKAQLEARVAYLEGEVKSADRIIKKLSESSNKDVAIANAVVAAVDEHLRDYEFPAPKPYARKAGAGTPQEFVAHISDLHYGEVVDPEIAMGIEYNPSVAKRRMEYLAEKICRYAELRPYEISKLHVAYLGDMVSGIQHEDLDTTNARSMMDQALEVAEMMHTQLAIFSDHFPEVHATVITGNHGRVHKQGRHKSPFENWDYIAGMIVQKTAKLGLDDRVTVTVPRAAREIITVAEHRIALMHGDGIKAANFAGIPFYSSKAKHDALQTLLRKLGLPPVDQISVGHFHQLLHWPNVMVFNGSIKGGDEYVMDTRLAYTPAQQLLQEWHPKYGLTTHDFIDVDRVH